MDQKIHEGDQIDLTRYFITFRTLPVATFLTTFLSHSFVAFTYLDNTFLRYDDTKNFNNHYVDGSSLFHALSIIWFNPKESTILAVWEPVAQTVKLFTSLIFGNTRFAHSFVSIFLFAIASGYLVNLDPPLAKSISPRLRFLVVTLFAMSPVRVEVIAWASCQSYVLALLFSVLFTHSWNVFRSSINNRAAAFAAVLFFALSTMSKAASLPVFLYVLVAEVNLHTLKDLPPRTSQHYSTAFVLGTVALCSGYMHMTANVALNEHTNKINIESVKRGIKSTAHYFQNVVYPRTSCVHFFYTIENITESSECIVRPVSTNATLAVVLVTLTAYVIVASRLRFCYNLMFLLTHLIAFAVFASPGIVASSFGLHGAEQGGAAHDRYSILSEALIGCPAVMLLFGTIHNRTKKLGAFVFSCSLFLILLHRIMQLPNNYKRWTNTSSLWEDALLKNPNDVHALLSIGEVFSYGCSKGTAHGCDTALKYMEKAMSLDATKPTAWYNYGTTLFKAERKQEALAAMVHAHMLDPADVDTMDRVIHLSSETGDIETFTNHIEKAVVMYAAKKHHGEARMSQVLTIVQSLPSEKKLDILVFICDVAPSAAALGMLGGMQHQGGKIQHAIETYEKALKLDPSMSDVLHNQGIGLYQLGLYQLGAKVLEKAMDMHPEDKEMKRTYQMIREKMRQQ